MSNEKRTCAVRAIAVLVVVLASLFPVSAAAGQVPQQSGFDRPHSSRTLSITLSLGQPEYGSCGAVSINGYVGTTTGSVTNLSWDWGDGTVVDSWFPASHRYLSNGSYPVQVTATSDAGESLTNVTAVVIDNADDPGCQPGGPAVLILVEESLASELGAWYAAFKARLAAEGTRVFEATVSAGTEPPAIKELVRTYWQSAEYDLQGAILVGNIKAAYAIIHTGDYSDPEHQEVWLSLDAADMYYKDLTGSWDHLTVDDLDTIVASAPPQVSGVYLYSSFDTFKNEYLVSLDKDKEWDYRAIEDQEQYEIEIWVGRIMGHNIVVPGKTEAEIVEAYFERNYQFRVGNQEVRDRALLLNAGSGYNDQGMDYTGIFTEVLMAEYETKDMYLEHLQASGGSKLLYLTAHSSPKVHVLYGDALWASEMNALHKNSVFYLLNACSACRWDEFVSTPDDPDYLGGLYVFSKTHQDGDFGLGATCFTGVGGFNNLSFFTDYYHSHPGASYGDMYVHWYNLNLAINFGPSGYVFLGDPTIGPDTGSAPSVPEHMIFLPLVLSDF